MTSTVTSSPRRDDAPLRHPAVARRAIALLLGAGATTVLLAVVGFGVGSHPISPAQVLDALTAYDPTRNEHVIVMASRVPRMLLGILVGAALGMAGALMQSLTRNPLADPGILGVNAGASLLVVVAIAYLGVTSVHGYIWFAFAGAALAAVLVFALGSAHRSGATPVRFALAGTAVAIAIGAVTQMILISNETAFQYFRFWSVGSLQGRGLDVIVAVLPFLVVGLSVALLLARPLDSLALGDAAARSLGTSVGAVRASTALAVVLLAGGATAAAGPIGFIGLAAAHIVRQVVGNSHRWLLPCSIVVGAGLLVSADTLGRALVAPADLQSGIAAALLGSPLFIALVRSRRVASL
ncbi:FecCD family ABC transporter permease [Microbacterium saperdae]|uniref:Iron complex transport system permease protein n=1 Tax=Microbacterium saperdae TaxID=69368 RepID=A0A543BQE4_9MICO|nr:iron ABC transporter permease [Microbacterium saperdae]TQL87044.1 iron complex transport system permease protein [Microbacterium saperdae]GGM43291.1 ABC transporter permease [Microbacterium saperdae]